MFAEGFDYKVLQPILESRPQCKFKIEIDFKKILVKMSKCPSVCVSVCLSICSLLWYRFKVFLPLLSEVGCPIFLEIQNPWGKVMERNVLRFEHFCLEVVLNRKKKKFFG